MRSSFRSFAAISAACLLAFFGITGTSQAQSAKAVAASARILSPVEPSQTVQLKGHIPGWASAGSDLGGIAPDQKLTNLHLILSRAPAVEAAFDQLLLDQQNPSSPRYHQWLTPQQNAEQYGVAASDLATVKTWLQSQGLSVDDVAAGGVFITFSGKAADVESAFATKLHNFSRPDGALYAPVQEPSIPAAIATVITTVAGLDDTRAHTFNRHEPVVMPKDPVTGAAQPYYTGTSGTHYLAPVDFNIIYNNISVLAGGITGSTSRVLILDYGRVASSDISYFQTYFALPTTALPNTILLAGSADPGYDGINGWQAEGTLDVERVQSVAPGAPIDYYIAGTSSYGNTFSQLQYNISTLNDPIVSMSFGSCEVSGSSTATTFDNYFKTGSAQGIAGYASSGDTGASGCDSNGSAAPASPQPNAANVVCVSSYVTCVGGTEFSEGAGAAYWSSTTNATNKGSALSYIPEGAWNDPSYTNSSNGTSYAPASSGGGVSYNIAKPSFQTGTGVPADGKRDTPDMSFTASGGHDGYLIYVTAGLYSFGGTSASAPSMAGVAALLNQKKGAAQGSLNPLFYSLAATPTNNVFHDITIATSAVSGCVVTTPSLCNNSAPAPAALLGGQAGYLLQTGYDLVTGLGTIDIQNLLNAASPVTTALALTATPNPATVGTAVTLTATLTPGTSTATPTGTVQFYSNGTAIGAAVTLASNKATYSYTAPSAGTYAITAIYSGDASFSTSTATAVSLVVNSTPTFTVTPAATTLALVSGATTGNTVGITLASVNNFTGAVALTCTATKSTGTAAGTCTVTPPSVTLASGGTGTATLTVNTTNGSSGVLNVTVTGTSGSTVITSAVVAVTITAPGFTITPAVSSLTVASGATTGNTALVTLTSTNNFAGSVALTCALDTLIPPTGNVTPTNTTCSVISPVTLTAGGSATATVTINSTFGAGGTFNAIIGGTGTNTGSTIAATSSASLPVIVTAPGFTLGTATATPNPVVSGNTVSIVVPVTSVRGYAGPVAVTCTAVNTAGSAAGSCASATVTLTSGGTANATLVLSTAVGTSGALLVTLSATGTATGSSFASPAVSATGITVTLNGAALTAAPASAGISFTSGAASGNTDTVTLTSTNAFVGTVNLTCSVALTSGAPASPATCTLAPASVTLTSGGTATTVVTISSVTAHAKVGEVAGLSNSLKAGGAMFALLFCLLPFRKRKAIRSLMAFVVLLGGLSMVSGCGGGGNAPKTLSSSAGSYTVTVTGTGTTTGASAVATTSTTFTVNIN